MIIYIDFSTSQNQNLTLPSKAQNAKGGGRYHNTLNIGLSQCLKIVLLYLSFVIFFLLNSKSVYADIFTANFPKTITNSATDTENKTIEQCLLTVNKDTGINSVTVKVRTTTISPVTSDGNTYWINKGENPTVEATAKSGYKIIGETGSIGTINIAKTVSITSEPEPLKFSSDSDFALAAPTPTWNGIIEYSIDNGSFWATWDGSPLYGTASQSIYLRGIGNTQITDNSGSNWEFTGKYCTGNIETLLDYQTVLNGQHPVMADYCYSCMFQDCTSLTTPPQLPATTLVDYCYQDMFRGCESLTTVPELPATTLATCCYDGMFQRCTSLITPPQLPATTLANYCYQNMFSHCESLTTVPELPATTLATSCYAGMFYKCTSLTTPPQLPATTLALYCYYNMFADCTSLKLSTTKTGAYQYEYRIPTTGTGTIAGDALTRMFADTGGTFKGTPTINTTYYTDHKPI